MTPAARLDLGAIHAAIAGPEADSLLRELGGAHAVFEASGKAPAVDAAYRWVRPGGRLIIYSAPDEPVLLDVMSVPREASLIVARPREGAVLRSVVNLVESGALPREFFLPERIPSTASTTRSRRSTTVRWSRHSSASALRSEKDSTGKEVCPGGKF